MLCKNQESPQSIQVIGIERASRDEPTGVSGTHLPLSTVVRELGKEANKDWSASSQQCVKRSNWPEKAYRPVKNGSVAR